MYSFKLTKSQRNLYLRRMLNTLVDKYLVERPKLGRAVGMYPSYIADFLRGSRNLSHPTMDRIEAFINDLYEPIIRDEIDINKMFIEELIEASNKEVEGSSTKAHESGLEG